MRRKILNLRSAILLIIGFISFQGWAQGNNDGHILIYPSFTFNQERSVAGGVSSTTTLDVRAGYVISAGWYFGMIFTARNGSGVGALKQSGFGNSVGYRYDRFMFITSYYLIADADENGNLIHRDNGTGWQVDLSYTFPIIDQHLEIGPVLTYKVFTYDTETAQSGAVTGTSSSQSFFYPFIGLLISF